MEKSGQTGKEEDRILSKPGREEKRGKRGREVDRKGDKRQADGQMRRRKEKAVKKEVEIKDSEVS